MVRHIDAIYTQGAFRPLEPIEIPDGTRVHLSVEEECNSARPVARILTPKLAHREDVGDFVMEVRENGDARL